MSEDIKVALVTGGNRGIGYELIWMSEMSCPGVEAYKLSKFALNGLTQLHTIHPIVKMAMRFRMFNL